MKAMPRDTWQALALVDVALLLRAVHMTRRYGPVPDEPLLGAWWWHFQCTHGQLQPLAFPAGVNGDEEALPPEEEEQEVEEEEEEEEEEGEEGEEGDDEAAAAAAAEEEEDDGPRCFCGELPSGIMFDCANDGCRHGQIHKSCTIVQSRTVPDDWTCQACRADAKGAKRRRAE